MSLDTSTLNSGFQPTERQLQNDKARASPDQEMDSRSEMGSVLESGFSSSIDQEEAIVRLAQESQVLRAVVKETNQRLQKSDEESEALRQELNEERERYSRLEESVQRLESGAPPKMGIGGALAALIGACFEGLKKPKQSE